VLNEKLKQAFITNNQDLIYSLVKDGAILDCDSTKSLLKFKIDNALLLRLAVKGRWISSLEFIVENGLDIDHHAILDVFSNINSQQKYIFTTQDKSNFEKLGNFINPQSFMENYIQLDEYFSEYINLAEAHLYKQTIMNDFYNTNCDKKDLDDSLETETKTLILFLQITRNNLFEKSIENGESSNANINNVFDFKNLDLEKLNYRSIKIIADKLNYNSQEILNVAINGLKYPSYNKFFKSPAELLIQYALEHGAIPNIQNVTKAWPYKKNIIEPFIKSSMDEIRTLEDSISKLNNNQEDNISSYTHIFELAKKLYINVHHITILHDVVYPKDIHRCSKLGRDYHITYESKKETQYLKNILKELSQYNDFIVLHSKEIEQSLDIDNSSISIQDEEGPFAGMPFTEVIKSFIEFSLSTHAVISDKCLHAKGNECQYGSITDPTGQEALEANQANQLEALINNSVIANIVEAEEVKKIPGQSPIKRSNDNRPSEVFKSLAKNFNFDTMIKYSALDFLSKNGNAKIIFSTGDVISNKKKKIGGFADVSGNIALQLSLNDEWNRATFSHEMGHKVFWAYNNYESANPYNLEGEQVEFEFDKIMHESLTNLYKFFDPKAKPLLTTKELAEGLKKISPHLDHQDQQIIATLSSDVFLANYEENNFHEEFVVRFLEIIAHFNDLPPYIRECFKPIEVYYKTRITPNILDEIAEHPLKSSIASNNHEKFAPETILNFSGEDYLIYKKDHGKHLTEQETKTLSQIEEIEDIIVNGKLDFIQSKVIEFNNEIVTRAALSASIELGREDFFDKIMQHIQVKQYLGPQLVLATKLNKHSMVEKLIIAIDHEPSSQYYFAKAAEIALEYNDSSLLTETVDKINHSWFLNGSFRTMIDENKSDNLKKIILNKYFNERDNFGRNVYNVDQAIEIINNPLTKDIVGNNHRILRKILGYIQNKENSEVYEILENDTLNRYINNDPDKLFMLIDMNIGISYYINAPIKHTLHYPLELLQNSEFADFIYGDIWYLQKLVDLRFGRKDIVSSMFNEFSRELINKDSSKIEVIVDYLSEMSYNEKVMYTGFATTKELPYMKFVDHQTLFSSKSDLFMHLVSHKETKEFIGKDWDKFQVILKLNASEGRWTFSLLENCSVREIINGDLEKLVYLARFDNPEKIIDILSHKVAREYIGENFNLLKDLINLSEEDIKVRLGLEDTDNILSTPYGYYQEEQKLKIIKSTESLEIENVDNLIKNFADNLDYSDNVFGDLSNLRFDQLAHHKDQQISGDSNIFHFVD
jgi:hypothetical protein